jgi:pseudaminic acid cytidylyltransferase
MELSIAIITARGGSKRIPRKNIRPFCGRPIIEYSIKAAIESGCFSEVMVSTDDDEIASIAKAYGASIPFMRSASTSDDYATTVEVLREVLKNYENIGKSFSYGCCIYPTAPFVTSKILKESMHELIEKNLDCVLPIVKFSFPIQRSFRLENDLVEYAQPEYARTRSQDLEFMYHDVGQFYCFDTEKFLANNNLITSNTKGVLISEMTAQDIDTEDDWKLAEMKWQILNNQ